MSEPPVLVINPNSSAAVTAGIDAAVAPLRSPDGPAIECVILAEGPPGIETEADIAAVVAPLLALARCRPARALVIACFSDPAVPALRAELDCPVFGIAEAAMQCALGLGDRFGILSILEGSIPRHRRQVQRHGLEARFAGDLALGVGVTGLAEEAVVLDRLLEVGWRLRDRVGADVLILGCAGMARYRDRLERHVGLPVIDPTQAATALAVAAVRLGWRTASADLDEPLRKEAR